MLSKHDHAYATNQCMLPQYCTFNTNVWCIHVNGEQNIQTLPKEKSHLSVSPLVTLRHR